MRASIDRMGRLVIPKAVRDRAGLRGGEQLEVEERDGVIELRPVPIEVTIVETPRGSVLHAEGDVPQLTDEMVRDILEAVRR